MPKKQQRREHSQKDATSDAGRLDTRQLILDTAEEIFAEQGIAAASMRSITTQANINMAAVNYHFGTKEALVEAILDRGSRALNDSRLSLLTAPGPSLDNVARLRHVVEAFLKPTFDLNAGKQSPQRRFLRFRARVLTESEPWMREMMSRHYDLTGRLFLDAICNALPHAPRKEVQWRFQFMLGIMVYNMLDTGRIQSITGGQCDPGNFSELMPRVVDAAVGMLSAPYSEYSPEPRATGRVRKAPSA